MAERRRSPLHALTALRFVAAARVVIFHTGPRPSGAPNWYVSLIDNGHVGVNLFFLLSGFILTYNYLDDVSFLQRSKRGFWGARLARVYPVYALGLLIWAPFLLKNIAAAAREGNLLIAEVGSLVLAPLLLQSWTPWTAAIWNSPG